MLVLVSGAGAPRTRFVPTLMPFEEKVGDHVAAVGALAGGGRHGSALGRRRRAGLMGIAWGGLKGHGRSGVRGADGCVQPSLVMCPRTHFL